jgi:hypothetical protein
MRIAALNAGGRSHRAQLCDVDAERAKRLEPVAPIWQMEVESASVRFHDIIADIPRPDAAVHRVVHGGLRRDLDRDALVDEHAIAAITAAVEFASAHNALALEGIDAITQRFGESVRQVEMLDSLRSDAPAVATLLSGPQMWRVKYGMPLISTSATAVRFCSGSIMTPCAPVRTFVIRTLEEWAMVRRGQRVLGANSG